MYVYTNIQIYKLIIKQKHREDKKMYGIIRHQPPPVPRLADRLDRTRLLLLYLLHHIYHQANWLSYGSAARHPCMTPQLDMNVWREDVGEDETGTCGALKAAGSDTAVWEVNRFLCTVR